MKWEKMNPNKIREFLSEVCPKAILVEGMDECIIGVSFNVPNDTNVVYSKIAIIRNLMRNNKMTYFDALQYLEFNIQGIKFNSKVEPMFFDDLPHPILN